MPIRKIVPSPDRPMHVSAPPHLENGAPPDLFGAPLEPALLEACGGALSAIRWFRADWQRGGALTGYAVLRRGKDEHPVVVKLPVPPQELLWLERLQEEKINAAAGRVVPHLYCAGRELGGYDLAWLVMQRMQYGPLDAAWNGREMMLLADAAARFYAASQAYPVNQPPRGEVWPDTLKQSRRALQELGLPEAQRWTQCLKTLQKKLPKLLHLWDARPREDWCHGDLHLANAMTDAPPPEGPAVLFDLAHVHAGHWVEDAVYFESLFWSARQRLGDRDIVKAIAAARKAHGLKGDPHWPRLAQIRRVLLAAATPAQQASRPDPAQLHAALAVLEPSLAGL